MTTQEKARIDFVVLTYIWHIEKSIIDIAEAVGFDESTVKSSVNRLKRTGKVTRRWQEFHRPDMGYWKDKYGHVMPHWHYLYTRVK